MREYAIHLLDTFANSHSVARYWGQATVKDANHVITHANERTAHQMGFKSVDNMIGKTACDQPTKVSEFALFFHAQDRLVMDSLKPSFRDSRY